MILWRSPRIVGGQDLEAGGTWFAIQPSARMFAGLTNRRYGSDPNWQGDASRGVLITEILKAATARGAVERLQTFLSETSVNHFMMLIGDTDTLYYVDYDSGRLTIDALSPGHYVLSNTPLSDGETTKRRWLKHLLLNDLAVEPQAFVERAKITLANEMVPERGEQDTPAAALDALNVRSSDTAHALQQLPSVIFERAFSTSRREVIPLTIPSKTYRCCYRNPRRKMADFLTERVHRLPHPRSGVTHAVLHRMVRPRRAHNRFPFFSF